MVQKTDEHQLPQNEKTEEGAASTEQDTTAAKPMDTSEIKRGKLSRGSTLESIKEEENSSLEERLLIESFQSITDIFGNEDGEADDSNIVGPAARKSVSGLSEDTDSLDEEVRRIMAQGDEKRKESWNSFPAKKHTEKKYPINRTHSMRSKDDDKDSEDWQSQLSSGEGNRDEQDSVPSETESESESDEATTDTEADEGNETDRSVNSWRPEDHDDDEESQHSDEEFDLDKYLDKLCLQPSDSGSSDDESDDDSSYSTEETKVVENSRKMSKSETPETDEDTFSESDDSEYGSDTDWSRSPLDSEGVTKFENNLSTQEKQGSDDEESGHESSDISSVESDVEFFFDDVDSASVSTDESFNENFDFEEHEGLVPEASQLLADELLSAETTNQAHYAVSKCYTGLDREKCPNKIDVHEEEIGNLPLHPKLSSPNVLSLRWPFTNYYVKEFDLEEKSPIYDDNDLLPSYKSMQSSASFPGRRRNVMQGRVWWVEWWANSASDDHRKDFEEKSGGEDSLGDITQSEQFDLHIG